MKKTRIKKRINPSKFLRSMLLVIMLTLALTVFIKSSATGTLQEEYKQITVKTGDTIWRIASDNKGNETNLEEMIYTINQVNNLHDTNLQPGQVLKIPLNF